MMVPVIGSPEFWQQVYVAQAAQLTEDLAVIQAIRENPMYLLMSDASDGLDAAIKTIEQSIADRKPGLPAEC
tara:strand:+ start:249 stop:464 length:216 start_codon:yes stop_codon:yes gene_type:complete